MTLNATQSKIERLACWSEPKPVTTRRGAALLRTASPTPAFWSEWRSDKEGLKAAGVTCGRNRQTNEWECCWWQDACPANTEAAKCVVCGGAAAAGMNCCAACEKDAGVDTDPRPAQAVEAATETVFGSRKRGVQQAAATATLPAGIVLSSEQEAICQWFASVGQPGLQNLVVDAKAGTGKTFTITLGFARVPQSVLDIYYLVFNKKNQREAKEKISDPRVTVLTLNACGWRFVRSVWTKAQMPDDSNGNPDVEADRIRATSGELPDEAVATVKRLVGFAKNLFVGVPTVGELVQVCKDRSVFCGIQTEAGDDEFPADKLAKVAQAAMHRALDTLESHNCIDFGDQVWLPVSKGWVRPCADLVVVDETQDMNVPQLEMVCRMSRKGGSVAVVGDPRQCIYTFRGAHPDGMGMMQRRLNAKVLGLSITRRCPKLVVAHVQHIVPGYQAAPDAPEGELLQTDMWELSQTAKPGDAVLSRSKAPLVPTCLGLLRKGVPARIEGRDIGKQLAGMVRSLKAKSVPDFLRKLERWAEKQKARVGIGERGAAKSAEVDDQRETLAALAEGCANVNEIAARITALFVDSDSEGGRRPAVVLSTVHKAKGLEWDKVTLLSWTFNRRRKGMTEEQEQEEANIYYVACTRAKRTLAFAAEEYRPKEDKEGDKALEA